MSTDPKETVAVVEGEIASPIENEIPTYRAISPGAVAALICGLMAVLSYAHWFFLVFSALAVVFGFLADRKIQRYPDMLTGRGLAQAGVALGLVFGLTSVTIATVQSFLIRRDAANFAQAFESVLTKGSYDDVIFYNQPPTARKNSSSEKFAKDLKAKLTENRMIEMQLAPFRDLKTAVDSPGAECHYAKIESSADDGRYRYAAALYEVHAPSRPNPQEKEAFALAVLKGMKTESGAYEWWVEDVKFPYKPSTFVRAEKAPDDGHGHGEGDGHGH
ncbi:MAG: DUF4190 domain-containing protein [Isosphaeraceae bacterium]